MSRKYITTPLAGVMCVLVAGCMGALDGERLDEDPLDPKTFPPSDRIIPDLSEAQCEAPPCQGEACASYRLGSETLVDTSLAPHGAPPVVVPEPPHFERVLRQAEFTRIDCPDPNNAACDAQVRGAAKLLHPAIPALRTSVDGHLVLFAGAKVGALRLEAFADKPLIEQPSTLLNDIVGGTRDIDFAGATVPGGLPKRSAAPDRTLCSADPHPYTCGEGGKDDCYDVTMIEDWQGLTEAECPTGYGHKCARLASIPLRVRIRDPKTANATVVEARATGSWTVAPAIRALPAEMSITADGRLLVMRLLGATPGGTSFQSGLAFDFRKDDGTVHEGGAYSLVYAFDEQPCGIEGWMRQAEGAFEQMRPVAAAHYDRRLWNGDQARYGLAAYPLRDSFGEPYRETELVRGSYPWVDRAGNNIFFSTILPTGVYPLKAGGFAARYPVRREHAALKNTGGPARGFAVAGSWTHGKTVMLDGHINNEDYGIRPGDTFRFGLYETDAGEPVAVRVDGNTNVAGFASVKANSQHIESLENTFYMHPGRLPVTPRDVVWNVTRGYVTEEVAFDDFLDPHVLLLAEMNAAWDNERELEPGRSINDTRAGTYLDGFELDVNAKVYVQDVESIRLQNAATSNVFSIPKFGVLKGNVRVEPVASGGIHGRGLWLEEGSSAHYAFDDDATLPARGYYTGVFVDRRADLADGRTLFAVGDTVLNAYPRGFSVVHGEDAVYFQLPCDHDWRASRGWHHVGMHVETDGNVTVFVDGNPIGTKRIDHISLLHAGMVVSLGAASDKPGVRGWFDEFRLVVDGDPSHLKSPSSIELLCNYARGTMAAFTSGSPLSEHGVLWDEIDARASLRGVTTKQDESLLCVTDYSRDLGVGRGRLPEGARSMRDAILELAEGTPLLQAGVPRPDTRTNSFCRSCHVAASEDPFRPAALLDTALSEGKVPVELDPRSQPMQPFAMPGQPPLVHGNIPEHWIMSKYGTAAPEAHQSLSEDYPVLNWLLAGF